MDRKANIWKVVRGLLLSCDSSTDIAAVVGTLRETEARAELIRELLAVMNTLESSPTPIPKKKVTKAEGRRYAPETVLFKLFRSQLKMSNQEVEIWLASRLGVSKRIGKSSLLGYLRTIIKPDPSGISRSVLSLASREFGSRLGSDTDLRVYWDSLDARANGDNNAIHGRTRKLSAYSQQSESLRD
jgi:hypothetical protein